jgi:hypothetical protein
MKKGIVYMHKFIYVHLRDWYYQQDGDDDFRARWQTIVLFTVTWAMPVLAISLVAVEGDWERFVPFDEFHMALRKILLIPVGLLCFGVSWMVFRLSGVRSPSVQYRTIHIGDYPRKLRMVLISAIVLLWFSPVWAGIGYIALTD